MSEYGGNDHEKLGLNIVSCVSQFTIPDTADMSPNPAWNCTDTRSSQPNPASLTPDYSYPLVSSPSFSSSSPISIIIAEHKVKSSLCISPCHHNESVAPCIAYNEYSIHWVQHTPSTAYTKYSIHQVQHTPSTAYTKYSIHRVQHTPSTAYTEYSIHPRLFVFPSFSWLRVDSWL